MTDISLTKGDSAAFRVTVDNNGSAFDVTGYSAYFTVKTDKTDDDTDAIIGPISGVLTTPTDGIIDFSMTTTETAVLAKTYFFDVEISLGANKYTVQGGLLTVNDDVTGDN